MLTAERAPIQHEQLPERYGSAAFNVRSYEKNRFTEADIRDDIRSYLGEYRFELQQYQYELLYSARDGEGYKLRDPNIGEAMTTKATRAILDRQQAGKSINREKAELVGLERLEHQLQTATTGDLVLWASPPGPKEEGYGEYGFVFIGTVDRSTASETTLHMTALRVEKPTLSQFNRFVEQLIEQRQEKQTAESFLVDPRIVRGLQKRDAEMAAETQFGMKIDLQGQRIFDDAMQRLTPLIDQFIQMARYGSKEEKLQAFHAIENVALALKDRLKKRQPTDVYDALLDKTVVLQLQEVMHTYNYEPPIAPGSCRSTETSINSNNILTKHYASLRKLIYGENDVAEGFDCPDCNYHTKQAVGNKCPGCGLTKEAYAKKVNGKVC